MDEDDLFSYSAIEIPTVVGLLKNILTQYPDNGQILKELVQNAEDAGATAFEVVHDTRSKRNGCVEFLQRFVEGPALFVYNDAEFTKDDWRGIRMLSESIKKKDLLKVGQFGLGFKSVFHFTDYVTIISGGNVLFMDPSEPSEKMCRDIPLNKLPSVLPVPECLSLWGIHLQKEHIRNGHFPGSIFWFSLRKEESKISSTVYRQENVERLFKSFSVEAPHCLTFLKALESISIRKVDENTSVNILKVSLNEANLVEAREKRREFREELHKCKGYPCKPLLCKYDIIIDTQYGHQSGISEQVVESHQHYRILHYLPCTQEDDQGSQHMPLVGVAAPISPVKKDARGQIFCFLPLPLESVNNTNLPLQVNGYFVLDQNRRHVKWRTEESSAEPDVIWNESLVRDVLSTAYVHLLQDMHASVSSGEVSKESWYSLLPNSPSTASDTNGRWGDLSKKVWRKILQLPVVYSEFKTYTVYCPWSLSRAIVPADPAISDDDMEDNNDVIDPDFLPGPLDFDSPGPSDTSSSKRTSASPGPSDTSSSKRTSARPVFEELEDKNTDEEEDMDDPQAEGPPAKKPSKKKDTTVWRRVNIVNPALPPHEHESRTYVECPFLHFISSSPHNSSSTSPTRSTCMLFRGTSTLPSAPVKRRL